jgi:Rrf2 family protein
MRISSKADYALRTLVHLTELYRGPNTTPVSIRVLASRNDIPKRFLEQIMIDLRTRGWVKSLAGRDGGFILGMPPDEITMGDVVRHFDGTIAPIDCVSVTHYHPCSQEPVCQFRRILMEIRDFTSAKMDKATLASVAAEQVVKPGEVIHGFCDGDGI